MVVLIVLMVLALTLLATWVVARGAAWASRRLGIDWPATLLWLGLAELPPEDGVPERSQRLAARSQARRPRQSSAQQRSQRAAARSQARRSRQPSAQQRSQRAAARPQASRPD